MHFELRLEPDGESDPTPSVEVGDSYVDLVYGPVIGAMAVLLLRYLHASMPLRSSSICSTQEMAEGTGSRSRRMQGPLGRLDRHRLIGLQRPVDDDLEATVGRIILYRRLPLISSRTIDRLPPLARSVARSRLDD